MVDATTLDIYSTQSGDKTYLSLDIARQEKLLNKWMEIETEEVRTMNEKDFQTGEEKEVDKIVLGFKDMEYSLPLNKTNGRVLIKDYGTDTKAWIGTPIKLKVNTYPSGTQGIGIKSLQDLEDEGESPPTTSITPDEKAVIKKAFKESNAIRNIVDDLNDMKQDVTIISIMKELKTAMAQNEITKKQYTQALEQLA
jgi:hypothetical protein